MSVKEGRIEVIVKSRDLTPNSQVRIVGSWCFWIFKNCCLKFCEGQVFLAFPSRIEIEIL